MPLTEAEIRAALGEAGLEDLADAILSSAKPAIEIVVKRQFEQDPDDVVSKLCGYPDLPLEYTWPAAGYIPLDFIGQFRLDELPAFAQEHGLPAKGLLSIFYAYDEGQYDTKPEYTACVIFPDLDQLERRRDIPRPPEWPHGDPMLPAELEFRTTLAVPPGEHAAWRGADAHAINTFFESLKAHLPPDGANDNADADDEERTAHQLFGWPWAVQDDPTSYLKLEDRDKPGEGIMLFAQLDSWSGHVWGDMGRLYIMGDEEKLSRGDLSECLGLCEGH